MKKGWGCANFRVLTKGKRLMYFRCRTFSVDIVSYVTVWCFCYKRGDTVVVSSKFKVICETKNFGKFVCARQRILLNLYSRDDLLNVMVSVPLALR